MSLINTDDKLIYISHKNSALHLINLNQDAAQRENVEEDLKIFQKSWMQWNNCGQIPISELKFGHFGDNIQIAKH